ncbi:MAG: hypothetical protein ABI844_12330 [Saprospiraceae bacterium]
MKQIEDIEMETHRSHSLLMATQAHSVHSYETDSGHRNGNT